MNLKLLIVIFCLTIISIPSNSMQPNYKSDIKEAVLNKEDVSYYEILFVYTKERNKIGYIDAFDLRRELKHSKYFVQYKPDSLLNAIIGGDINLIVII